MLACTNQRLIQPQTIGNLVVPTGMNAELIGPVVTVTGTVMVQGSSTLTVSGGGVKGVGSALPQMDGAASQGVSPLVAAQDHVHPTDTSRAASGGGNATGTWPISITGNAATVTGVTGTNSGDVTLGTASGLSLAGQVLSLQAASGSQTGALTSTDWTTFNGKQAALGYTPMKTDYSNAGTAPTWNQNTTGTAANLTAGVALPVATTLTVKDTTSSSPDYALGVGETATVTFSASTSVPLHIATVEGLYELSVQCDSTTTPGSVKLAYLLPNNTVQTSACYDIYSGYRANNTTVAQADNNVSALLLGWCVLWEMTAKVSTKTNSKSLLAQALYADSGAASYMAVANIASYWANTSTAWTSLGTITFGQAQSGIVTIRRIS
jgi:hypothetical protein